MNININSAIMLQNAIRDNQLAIYLQPIIDLKTAKACGAEVILRWPNAPYTINLKALISLAEKTGTINELTLWAIEQACKAQELLTKKGYQNHYISINLSPKNLTIPNLIEKIENTLLKYNVPPSLLRFELTESALVEQQEQMKLFITQLEELGTNVILDHFGSGYSSLSYLLNYSFSTLKVDKSFVADLSSSENNQVIVKTAIEMAHNLGMNIAVQGVENEATAALLVQLGADKSQGCYYSEPLPIDEYFMWLNKEDK